MSTRFGRKNHDMAAQTLRKPKKYQRSGAPRRAFSCVAVASSVIFATLGIALWAVPEAGAATTTVNLATASSYAVLAGSTITNTGPSVISGDIGLAPGSSLVGFPPGLQSAGSTNVDNAAATGAQTDLTNAYLDAASRVPFTTVTGDLGGTTLVSGVYQSASSLALTGTLTLNGGGNAGSVFIFQAGSTFTAATGSQVVLENGAQACNVFWQVGSSVTLGTTSQTAGTFMALTSITLDTGAQVSGRVLARNGAVTLDDNTISVPSCATAVLTTTTTAATTTSTVAPTTTTTTAATTTTTTHVPTTTTPPTTTTTVIPVGPPQTGFGGAAGPGGTPQMPLIVGSLALAALSAGLALTERRRNRRIRTGRHGPRDLQT